MMAGIRDESLPSSYNKTELQAFTSIVLKRCLHIVIVLIACAMPARAQYDASFAHYWTLEPFFNPATVGKMTKINVAAAYNMTMAGFENNPNTMYAGVDLPFYFLKSYHGAGLQLLNDNIGLFTHQIFSIQYSYKHRLFGGVISAGVQIGLISEGFNGSDLDLEDSSDPAFPTSDETGTGFDLSAGLYYIRGPWYLGASVLHATAPKVDIGESQTFEIDRTYYFTGGYNIKLRNPLLTIDPTFLARTDGTAWRVDITGRLTYTNDKKVLYGGLSYSPSNSFTLMIGGDFHGVRLGYSYEVYTSAISMGNGSHEVFIGYQTDINLGKKGRNKHKSVRLL